MAGSDESTEPAGESTSDGGVDPIISPAIDYWLISAVSTLYTIGVVAVVVTVWQALIQDDALVVPFALGAIVVFGTFLTIQYLGFGTLVTYTASIREKLPGG